MVTKKEIEDKYPIPADIEDIFDEAGRLMNETGEIEEALNAYLSALNKYPNHPRILNFVGLAYDRGKDFTRAEEYYRRAIDEAPDFAFAYSNLSLLYSRKGDLEQAEHYARYSIKLFKISPIPWNTLGICFAFKGETQRALEHFLAAYGYDPEFTNAAYNIACCYSLMNDTEKALKYLAISLDGRRHIELAEEDPVLSNIRRLPEFEKILDKARKYISDRDGSN